MAKKKSAAARKSGKRAGFRIDLIVLLKVFVSLFFIVLGIAGIAPGIGESVFSLNNNAYTLELCFGIVELLCGLFLLLSFFHLVPKKTVALVTLVILIFWVIRILLTKLLWGMPLLQSSVVTWLIVLCTELIVATTLAIIYARND
jgi:hypothetical protein